jgi:hypothetical protein
VCSFNKTGQGLRDLAMAFGTETQKDHWPHKWVTEDKIKYVGPKPAYENLTNQLSASNNITKEVYDKEVPEIFNTWELTQKYITADVKAT